MAAHNSTQVSREFEVVATALLQYYITVHYTHLYVTIAQLIYNNL